MNLKELSDHLGLSPTTVSRAMNGFPEVSEKTRLRVQQTAEKLGYRPSRSARSLATGRAYAIGHVILDAHEDATNPVFGDFITGAGSIYSSRGYRMVLSVVNAEGEESEYRNLHLQQVVDGVIVHSPHIDEPRLALLKEIGMPFVVHGRAGGADYDYSFCDVNNRRAFRRATHYLIELGHHRIALLNGPEQMNFAYRRRLGYEDALKNSMLPADPALMLSERMTMDYGYRACKELLESANPPTAFICASSVSAIGVQFAATQKGLTLGRDISLITHDDQIKFMMGGNEEAYNFTSMRSSVREAGRRSAEMLIDLIENPNGRHQQELWEAELVIGASTGPRR